MKKNEHRKITGQVKAPMRAGSQYSTDEGESYRHRVLEKTGIGWTYAATQGWRTERDPGFENLLGQGNTFKNSAVCGVQKKDNRRKIRATTSMYASFHSPAALPVASTHLEWPSFVIYLILFLIKLSQTNTIKYSLGVDVSTMYIFIYYMTDGDGEEKSQNNRFSQHS